MNIFEIMRARLLNVREKKNSLHAMKEKERLQYGAWQMR